MDSQHSPRGFAPATTAEPEEQSEEDGIKRTTCRTHRRWLHDCVASPLHVVIITGTSWCRACRASLAAASDH
ncbi:hypothetical protein ACIA5G_30720 [Amycolatopsis sp. NPDC051758]|uniref:hypothetical protein n=1 Tax=Amycolatopsis sp. NPDC051758 TaxID=3363935 RepID=UPI0037A2B4E5